MATVAKSPDLNAEQRLFLHNVSWQTYESLLTLLGDRPLRLTYDRGNLEITAPSKKHERLGHILGRLVVTLTEMDDNQVVRAFRRWVHDIFLADGGHA